MNAFRKFIFINSYKKAAGFSYQTVNYFLSFVDSTSRAYTVKPM